MKKNSVKLKSALFAVGFLAMVAYSTAQTKIGGALGATNSSAYLQLGDASGATKGFLNARVALTATNAAGPLTAHVAGMVVYNTATAGSGTTAVSPGYYYNDGTQWVRIAQDGKIILPNTSLSSSTSPAGVATGQVIYNTNPASGIPVGPVYWDGTQWVPTNQTSTISLTSGNSPAGTSIGQVAYNTSATAPTGLVYWDGTQWQPIGADPIIGNEVLNATTNKGLTRAGSGTAAVPYTLGLTDGTAANQTMVWNGSTWAPGNAGLVSTALTSTTTPAGTAVGTMIYNTNAASGVPVGPTYWDGTNWQPVGGNDPIIGNEVLNATTNKGLTRAGSGTVAVPYTLGLTDGTSANQTMVWNGTTWAPGNAGLVSTALTSTTTPAGTAVGTMIYNTNAASGVPVGPTYWDGTNWQPVGGNDPIIGNEVTDVVANKGLTRTGSGTAAAPYKVGMTDGTATGQVMKWDGTAWAPTSADNIYSADGTLAANRIVAQADKTLAFTSTAATGTSHFTVDGTTFNIDAVNNKIGIGVAAPTSKLEVNGAVTNNTAYNAAAGTTIDFALSNLAYTTASPGAFTLSNLKDGGTYTLAVKGTTSGTASFTATGFTLKSANNAATTAGKETIYTFLVIGSTVYYYMTVGF